MRTLLCIFAFLLGFLMAHKACASPTPIVVDESTILIRGEITTELVSKTIASMLLSKKEELTIFIDSPGGSVIDGLYLTNFIQHFPKKTTCVVSYAASMAFAITQSCTERLVMPAAVMMQHQVSIGVQGPLAKLEEIVRHGGVLRTELLEMQATRIGISPEKLEARTMNDWFLFGKEAVKENVADGLASVSCLPALVEKKIEEEVQVFIFRVKIVWSACPLIVAPLEVKMAGSDADKSKVKALLGDRALYTKELRGQ